MGLQAKKPVLYVGGGCLDCPEEVRELVRRTRIPVAQTLMGLGAFPETDPLALQARIPSSCRRIGLDIWSNARSLSVLHSLCFEAIAPLSSSALI